jgi:cytochrome c oxidase subunit 4
MDGHAHHEASPGPGHVAPLRLLVVVLVALLALTFVTVAVTWFDLGPLNLGIALGIAVVKASLVLLYFMHLRWDRPFHAVVLISSLLFVALFIGLTLLDSFEYQPQLIPGYSPALGR